MSDWFTFAGKVVTALGALVFAWAAWGIVCEVIRAGRQAWRISRDLNKGWRWFFWFWRRDLFEYYTTISLFGAEYPRDPSKPQIPWDDA